MSVLWWPSVATSGSPPASSLSTKIGCENWTACATPGSAIDTATTSSNVRRFISTLRRRTSHGHCAAHYPLNALDLLRRQSGARELVGSGGALVEQARV